MMGTMDPQCIVRCRTQEVKSVVFRSGGRAPDMNWKVTLNVGPSDSVNVIFHHPGAFNVTPIGTLSVPIQPLMHGRLVDEWYRLESEVRGFPLLLFAPLALRPTRAPAPPRVRRAASPRAR